jgi:uncharacterized surface protein with fasciclin (FAS1) repeats
MKPKLLAGVVFAVLLGAALPPGARATDSSSIYKTLSERGDLTVLSVAVAEAKEVATLKGPGPYTLFAPTDTAFKNLPAAITKKIATDKEFVKKLVRAHLARGSRDAAALLAPGGKELPPLHGGALKIESAKDGLRVGGAKVVEANVGCSNGVIHVIDAVLPVPQE